MIGIIGSICYSLGCVLLEKLNIDDPIEAFQVHGLCGLWGTLAVAIFHQENGLIYGAYGSLDFLKFQLIGAVCITAWTSSLSLIYFKAFKAIG